MLEEQGYRMSLYDPFFAPSPDALERRYDFITCTETVEHFYQPGKEFRRLDRLLRSGGWLGVMTEMLEPGWISPVGGTTANRRMCVSICVKRWYGLPSGMDGGLSFRERM